MLEVILVVSAGLVLIVAQILLARGYKKEKSRNLDYKNGYNFDDEMRSNHNKILKDYDEYLKNKRNKKNTFSENPNSRLFDTKYEEIIFLYKTGAINEDEYKKQVKNIIN